MRNKQEIYFPPWYQDLQKEAPVVDVSLPKIKEKAQQCKNLIREAMQKIDTVAAAFEKP